MNDNELKVFNANVNANKEALTSNMSKENGKVEKLLSTPNETEIAPLYAYILCTPFDKNPFNTITKSEGGLYLPGEGDVVEKNTDTGEVEESDNIMEVASVLAVGPEVKYVKEGDIIYYRRIQKVPIPFFRSGLITVNELAVMSVVNAGLTERFSELKKQLNRMEEKIYFAPGDMVQLRQELPNKPTMMVVRKETALVTQRPPGEKEYVKTIFIGIRCMWFTKNHELKDAIFNTKDLEKINY